MINRKTSVTMSLLRFLSPLFLLAASAWATDVALPPELHGILVTGNNHRFALVTPGGGQSGWATVGETFAGWKVLTYLPAADAVVLGQGERRVTVHLNTSTVRESDAVAGTKATVAEADELLGKMRFEAMWDRIAEEQKKGMIGAMRQQATAEFTKQGLQPKEIDALLDKMGDAVMAGLLSDDMRKDFAQIYADVYTKDELSGMAAFYDTTAGKAWIEKQPEVQQKLMQVMMPRVMQGMPAAQKIAADYFRQRAASPASVK